MNGQIKIYVVMTFSKDFSKTVEFFFFMVLEKVLFGVYLAFYEWFWISLVMCALWIRITNQLDPLNFFFRGSNEKDNPQFFLQGLSLIIFTLTQEFFFFFNNASSRLSTGRTLTSTFKP